MKNIFMKIFFCEHFLKIVNFLIYQTNGHYISLAHYSQRLSIKNRTFGFLNFVCLSFK